MFQVKKEIKKAVAEATKTNIHNPTPEEEQLESFGRSMISAMRKIPVEDRMEVQWKLMDVFSFHERKVSGGLRQTYTPQAYGYSPMDRQSHYQPYNMSYWPGQGAYGMNRWQEQTPPTPRADALSRWQDQPPRAQPSSTLTKHDETQSNDDAHPTETGHCGYFNALTIRARGPTGGKVPSVTDIPATIGSAHKSATRESDDIQFMPNAFLPRGNTTLQEIQRKMEERISESPGSTSKLDDSEI